MTAERLRDSIMVLDDGIERAFRNRGGNLAVEFAFAVGSAAYACAAAAVAILYLLAWESWHQSGSES